MTVAWTAVAAPLCKAGRCALYSLAGKFRHLAAETMTNDNNQTLRSAGTPRAPGMMSRIRTYFLTGLIVAGPVAVTLWLIWWFVTWVDNLVRPLIPVAYLPETYLPFNIPGLGLIIVFIALTLLGFLTANLIGRRLVAFGEGLFNHMPIVRPIYRTAKQIFQTLFSKSESSFRRVGAGCIPLAEHVVAGVFDAIADAGDFRSPAGRRACLGLHAVHAEPDDGFLFLRATARRDRSRHHRRGSDDLDHVGRHRTARRRARRRKAGWRRLPKPPASRKPRASRRRLR